MPAEIEHLIACGHRRIAHISGPSTNPEALERIRGYSDALTRYLVESGLEAGALQTDFGAEE